VRDINRVVRIAMSNARAPPSNHDMKVSLPKSGA
jgi:hypothetical protein